MKKIIVSLLVVFGSSNLYSQTITVDTTGVYKINAQFQTPPKFPGDMNEWLAKSVTSNGQAEGTAYVSFVIGTDGTISTIRMMGGGTPWGNFGEQAVKIVQSMPRWKPAMQNGKPISANYELGFVFGH
jgi:Gram-negative bacterial TonB protein C-terminal